MEKTMKVKIMAPTTLIVEGRPVSLNLFSEDEIKNLRQTCLQKEQTCLHGSKQQSRRQNNQPS